MTGISLIIGGVIVVFLLIILFANSYLTAPPDKAFIISGMRKKPKVFIGKAGLRIPFFERKDVLELSLIPIDVKTSSAVPTADFINIMVDAQVNVNISSEDDKIQLASQKFLNQDTEYIASVAREVLEGNMREIVGKMTLQEMVSDRQKFADLVKENADPDLAAMGLDIISFNVQNFIDNNKVIENLGVDNIAKIQKNAAIARAEAERDIAKAQANAKKEANDVQVLADTQIAIKQNELEIKKAELKANAENEKAKADAAYEIQKETQRKTLEITTADANIAKLEKETFIKQQEADIAEKQLDAQIRKKAEAEKFAALQKADADLYERQKNAEAERYEQEQSALALQKKAEAERFSKEQAALAVKAQALAEAESTKARMIAEAEGIRAKGEAEALAVQQKALAEAEGIDKKAEAMKKMGEASIYEMYFKALPEIAKNVASPLSNVDSITMYGEGNAAKLTEDITKAMSQITNGVNDSLGIDLKSVLGGFLAAKAINGENSPKSEE